MAAFLYWLHHNITAGLGRAAVWMENGRLRITDE